MRLNAYLARAGIASRRGSDELIKAGRVRVNRVRGELNTVVLDGDVVEVDGRPVSAQELAYVLLNKPAGVVTTASDPQGRPTVVTLVAHVTRVVPVGRPSCPRRGDRPGQCASRTRRVTQPSADLADPKRSSPRPQAC